MKDEKILNEIFEKGLHISLPQIIDPTSINADLDGLSDDAQYLGIGIGDDIFLEKAPEGSQPSVVEEVIE